MERARENDAAAWERIVVLYEPLVAKWCRRTGLPEADVPDVCQEVFRAVHGSLGGFRKSVAARQLPSVVMHYHPPPGVRPIAETGRPAAAVGGSDARELAENMPAPEEDDAEESEQKFLLRRALEIIEGDFDPRTWAAFWQVTVDERPAGDVASELGMTANAVYLAKSRVLKRLYDLYAELVDALAL